MRKFRERSKGERLLHAVNVNESRSRTCQGNFSHWGRCEKVQGKFKVGALTYSLQRQDEAIRDGHGEIQPDPVRLGRFMETSPTGVGVRNFKEDLV